jgi:hypothetical protein
MKTLLILLLSLVFNSCAKETKVPTSTTTPIIKNSFQAIWDEVNSDKLTTLPQDTVSFWKLKNIQKDAKRTIDNHADILASFDKLAHPNGICLKGIWQIDTKNPYSGYFKKNSKALIIARASSALSGTKQGETRAFGFAGKLFPTTNPTKINQEKTANFFLIDDLGGTKTLHYTDTIMTNEPKVSITSEVLKNLPYAIKVAHAFSKADKNSGIRQLYEISQLGETNNTNIITPKWMKLQAQKGQTVDAKDFRDELTITNDKKIVFDISVTSSEKEGKKEWKKIGTITFDNSVVSKTCEHRLHFHHPVWREDLRYF